MWIYLIKKTLLNYSKSFVFIYGLIWLFIESMIVLMNSNLGISYSQFLISSLFVGFIWMFIDGIWISGFYRTSIKITSNAFDTKIIIKYGDLFKQTGLKAIAVNDFFDSKVDDRHVSQNSLHGKLLNKYWGGNIDDWDKQVDFELNGASFIEVIRTSGKNKKYEIGTTAMTKMESNKFLCFALSTTNIETLQVKTFSSELIEATKGLLRKARSNCSGFPLSIPLLGAGLSRTGNNSRVLIDLMLVAIFEETKSEKVTDEIQITLPWNKISAINLLSIKRDWS